MAYGTTYSSAEIWNTTSFTTTDDLMITVSKFDIIPFDLTFSVTERSYVIIKSIEELDRKYGYDNESWIRKTS